MNLVTRSRSSKFIFSTCINLEIFLLTNVQGSITIASSSPEREGITKPLIRVTGTAFLDRFHVQHELPKNDLLFFAFYLILE